MKEEVALKEKRKWQIALRRYILESQPSTQYAPYFGITNEGFRKWIAFQLGDLTWEDFGKKWQLEHIVPFQYFDIGNDSDLMLCWNFLNIRVKKLEEQSLLELTDISAIAYFEYIYQSTQLPIAVEMIRKLQTLKAFVAPEPLANWFEKEKENLLSTSTLDPAAIVRLNNGVALEHLIAEQKLLQKFGG